MAITQFTMQDGREQHATYFRVISNYNWHLVFAGAGVKTVDVPAGARRVLFSSTVDNAVACDDAAVFPVADSTAESTSEFNPAALWIEGVAQLSVATGAAGTVSLTFYS